MKTNVILILFLFFLLSGCCDDDYRFATVVFNIVKDDKPLIESDIYPSFVYIDENNNEINLYSDGLTTTGTDYSINRIPELQLMSFKPSIVIIKYHGLPVSETDTLEILLDYDCDNKHKCSCRAIVLKYMKCNSVFLDDFTIRK